MKYSIFSVSWTLEEHMQSLFFFSIFLQPTKEYTWYSLLPIHSLDLKVQFPAGSLVNVPVCEYLPARHLQHESKISVLKVFQ